MNGFIIAAKRVFEWVREHSVYLGCLLIFMTALSAPILIQMMAPQAISDIPEHSRILQESLVNRKIPIYSIYYFLIWAGSFFDPTPIRLRVSSFVVLFVCKMLSAILVYLIAERRMRTEPFEQRKASALLVSMAMMVMMPVVNPIKLIFFWNETLVSMFSDIYLLHISPNVWHNSTMILAMPAVILTFYAGSGFLREMRRQQAVILGICLLVCTLCKPNYTLAFSPAFIIFYAYRAGFLKTGSASLQAYSDFILNNLISFAPSVFLLAAQYLTSFLDLQSTVQGQSCLAFAPFAVWAHYTANIPLSMARSLILPASILIFPGARAKIGLYFVFALGIFVAALLQVVLLAEQRGSCLDMCGNWFWGAHMALFVLLMECLLLLIRLPLSGLKRFLILIAALYVVSGLIYIIRLLVGYSYH